MSGQTFVGRGVVPYHPHTVHLDKYYLNLASEYRVASELLRRGIFATITYGNKKGADIYALGSNRSVAIIEVKASNSSADGPARSQAPATNSSWDTAL